MSSNNGGKKEARPPYVSKTAVDAFFEKIQGLKDPGIIDRSWATNYGLDPSLPAAVPGMLAWLGVTDANGKTTSGVWDSLRIPASRAEALTVLMQESYKEVFGRLDLEHATREHVNNAFIQSYGTGNVSRPVGCFLALCSHAGIVIGPGEKAQVKTTTETKKASKASSRATERKPASQRQTPKTDRGGSTTVIHLNVEIPAEWSEEQIRERLDLVRRAAEDEQAGA